MEHPVNTRGQARIGAARSRLRPGTPHTIAVACGRRRVVRPEDAEPCWTATCTGHRPEGHHQNTLAGGREPDRRVPSTSDNRHTPAVERRSDGESVSDVQVLGPDGCAYRICSRRRGEPLRRWDGVDTGFGPLDLLIFLGALSQRVLAAVRVHVRRGWTVGVLREMDLRWKVVHREYLDDAKMVAFRVQELVRAVEAGVGFPG